MAHSSVDLARLGKEARIGGSLLLAFVLCGGGWSVAAENEPPTEADIAQATASLLDRSQFSQRPTGDWLSSRFLQGYLDALDGSHLLFLQSDWDEFARLQKGLAESILRRGDTQPAHLIYARYLKRLGQQGAFAANLLRREKFDFTGTDTWQADRHDAAPPRDLEAAEALWRGELRAEYLREKLGGSPETNIASILTQRYNRWLQNRRQLDSDDVLGIYLDALAHAYDPHSDYFGRKEAEAFRIEMSLSLFGIGGSLQVKDGNCIITEIAPGGPAARSGVLKVGDRILSVAQEGGERVDVTGMSAAQVVGLIRGPRGSVVRLTIIPARRGNFTPKTVALVRDKIRLEEEHAKAAIIDLPENDTPPTRIGIVELPIFYGKGDEVGDGASADLTRLIWKLKRNNVAGVILDLRRNAGGSVMEAIRLEGLFVPSAPVLQSVDASGDVEIHESPQGSALYDGPLIVLTSRLTASASEIVAGAMQDYGRALIVGDSSTFGKGTIQSMIPLRGIFHERGLGAVMVTTGKFYRPSGASTQLKGVTPDIVLPSETDTPDIGEIQLPNALPWDVVPTAEYKNFNLVTPVLDQLRKKSSVRIAVDPGFQLVREEQAMAQKESGQIVSLNEAARCQIKTKSDGLQEKLTTLLRESAAKLPPILDLTLTDIDAVGLPPVRQPMAAPPPGGRPPEIDPADDIELREAEHILDDYIHALALRAEVSREREDRDSNELTVRKPGESN